MSITINQTPDLQVNLRALMLPVTISILLHFISTPDITDARESTDIIGTITARREGTVSVEFKPNTKASPKLGDLVDFQTEIQDIEVDAGKGEVVEVNSSNVWVKVLKGRPHLKMSGIIHATGKPGTVEYLFNSKITGSNNINDTYEVISLQFFEASSNAPEKSKRRYQTEFNKNSTRRVLIELTVNNLLYQKGNHEHKVEYNYYNPDGSLLHRINKNFNIKSEWGTAWQGTGYGWDTPGNWPEGNYRVKVFIDGKEVIAKSFSVLDRSRRGAGITKSDFLKYPYEIISLQFFEASSNEPEKSKRRYKTEFNKATTRRIWAELSFKNLIYQKGNQEHKIEYIYYNPDGSQLCRMNKDFNIKPEWQTAWQGAAYGWETPGNWPKGTYRVKVFIDAKEVMAKSFSIVPQ